MPRSKYVRVHLPYTCERCGKEEFEGFVFGEWRARHLRAQSTTRAILCDRCLTPPKLPIATLSAFFTAPAEIPDVR